ncbi:MAG: transcription-repair coupling factor (superfamily II helicase) [Sphingobacteriales bacterium]|jgi:transcription-repair coupling factor (superfamily II helicase)
MDIKGLLGHFTQHPVVGQCHDQLSAGTSIHIKGLAGSGRTCIISLLAQLHEKRPHLLVMDDKEEAAYLQNDLEECGIKSLFYPESYRNAYEIEHTDNANIQIRTEVLTQLSKNGNRVVITYPAALFEKVVRKKTLKSNTFKITPDQELSIDFLNEVLMDYEFERVDFVAEPGHYAIRGGIVDVFSYSEDFPFRIEFFGDEIESIRSFDPGDQLSMKKLTNAVLVPNMVTQFVEEEKTNFIDFLGKDTLMWVNQKQDISNKLGKYWELAQTKYATKKDGALKFSAPEDMYVSPEKMEEILNSQQQVVLGIQVEKGPIQAITFQQKPQTPFHKKFDLLAQELKENAKQGIKSFIFFNSIKQKDRLEEILESEEFNCTYESLVGPLTEGFYDKDINIAVYTDHQIFERYHRFRLKEGYKKNAQSFTLKELNSLKPGDYVVHIDHGVGKFAGLQKIEVSGKIQEAIKLIYRDNDELFVSIHSLHRISKFSGSDGAEPKIHKLGGTIWKAAKKKTKAKVKEIAFDLIQLYAKRKTIKGTPFSPDTYLQTELEASFIYEDTPDQETATKDVKADMESETPMDRLVCGDVGFGKTEIAIRAAFKAVTDNKQVAVLVPTTVLSMQHFKSFRKRLKDFPCSIDFLNRFKTAKQNTETFKKLESGETDIVIGTHALVGKKVKFKDLGLLIIDEEQKFGVGVKDKLKTFKENLDTLTLTATPIPRTLQFSLMQARDLSVINTAPPNRHPIETKIQGYNEAAIRDAIQYELSRNGQVYYVHNRVENIKDVAGVIQRLIPDARVGIGHGQMDGKSLEDVMSKFTEGFYDILLATTIIESGIDIPNANTIIINNAQNFGLSDLHQLRGRVGRSNKRAFCHLLCPPMHTLSSEARKRLTALEQFSDLGSGLNIAMRDLDIRGAGNLLGGEQSGFINELGFDAYQNILNEAITELKWENPELLTEQDKKAHLENQDCILETDFEVHLPEEYVNLISERLMLYRKLDSLNTEEELNQFRSELVDRFGPLPEAAENLLTTIEIKWVAQKLGFEKLLLKQGKLIGYFFAPEDHPYYTGRQFSKFLECIQSKPTEAKIYEKKGNLRFSFNDIDSPQAAIHRMNELKG